MSTLAGNIAENAGGLRGLKYGVTKDYLMGLEFFDATGELVKTGSRTVKCVTGYNLAGMMLQSEGTLGVISQAVLKLVPPPKASKALMAVFDDMQKAAEAVAGIIAAHVVPCTLEFLDNNTIVRVDDYTKAGLPRDAAAILLIEVDGHPAQVADEAVVVERVLQQTGAVAVHVAKDAAEKFKLWEARRQALPVLARCKPTTVLEDATVPRSQIPAMMKAVNDIAKKYNVEVGTFGHAGDGNLHPTFLCDKRDKEEFARVEAAVDEMFDVAISLHGTLSGEHGIGTAKARWLEKETSPRHHHSSRSACAALWIPRVCSIPPSWWAFRRHAMSDLKKLAKRLMTLDDRIIACMKCGMCQAVCPMFGATMMEADVARGKLALVDNLAHEMIADPEAVADKLGRCLLCGSCEANCPSGVKIMDIFMEAREIVNTYIGLHPVKKMVFRALLPYPGLFNFAMRVGAPMQRVIFRSNKDTQNTACAPHAQLHAGRPPHPFPGPQAPARHLRQPGRAPRHGRSEGGLLPRLHGGQAVCGCVRSLHQGAAPP